MTAEGAAMYRGSVVRRAAVAAAVAVLAALAVPPVAAAAPSHACAARQATIVGTAGDDRLVGTDGPDVIVGLGGDDVILAGGGGDVVCGNRGADDIVGGPGDDRLYGKYGRDRIDGGTGDDIIHGGPNADALTGGSGDDRVLGGPRLGPDVLDGGTGNDDLRGGPGWDIVTYQYAHGVTVNLRAGSAQDGSSRDVLRAIEAVVGSDGDDTIVGLDGYDATAYSPNHNPASPVELYGGPGDDVLIAGQWPTVSYGGAGTDTLRGGTGSDFMVGGPGDDTLSGGGGTVNTAAYGETPYFPVGFARGPWSNERLTGQPVTIDLAAGVASTPEGSDSLSGINAVVGSRRADTILGDEGANFLYPSMVSVSDDVGGDRIEGRGGDDLIDASRTGWGRRTGVFVDAGDGNDFVEGSFHDDRIWGGRGRDELRGINGSDRIDGGDDSDLISGEDDSIVLGAAGDDLLVTSSGSAGLQGGAGHDRCRAGVPSECEQTSRDDADHDLAWEREWWESRGTPQWLLPGWNVSECNPGQEPECITRW